MIPTDAPTFTRRLEKHGLVIRGVSMNSALMLARMESEPIAVVQRLPGGSSNSRKGHSVGPLVTNSLAQLNAERTFYVATDKGREWLARLREKGILP